MIQASKGSKAGTTEIKQAQICQATHQTYIIIATLQVETRTKKS